MPSRKHNKSTPLSGDSSTPPSRRLRCLQALANFGLSLSIYLVFTFGLGWPSWGQSHSTSVQPPPFGKVVNFEIPDYYPPPNENRLRSILRGAEAEPLEANIFWIKKPVITVMTLTGETNLVVIADDCLYNLAERHGWSTNRIEAILGNGKIRLSGQGYFWKQDELVLQITNTVHGTISR